MGFRRHYVVMRNDDIMGDVTELFKSLTDEEILAASDASQMPFRITLDVGGAKLIK